MSQDETQARMYLKDTNLFRTASIMIFMIDWIANMNAKHLCSVGDSKDIVHVGA